MDQMLRRILTLGVGGALLLTIITGCTLRGAESAPLTPAGPGTGGETVGGETGVPDLATPTESSLPPIPSPTPDTGPIDVFGTQTALAPVGGETSEPGGFVGTPATGETPATPATPTPGVTTPQVATPSPTVAQATVAAEDCPETHTVQKGENLFRIALKYGITVKELAEANGITNPDKIQAGTVLKIPGCKQGEGDEEQTYVVQKGDTLYSIALKFGVKWQELAAYNDITNPDLIYVGQELKIPPKTQ